MCADEADSGEEAGRKERSPDPSAVEHDRIRRARNGDAEAFSELVRAHQDAIFGLAWRFVPDRFVAEELTQDVFLKAWRNLPGFRGDSPFATWLYRIAVNLCQDYRQSRSARRRQRETTLEDREIASGANLPPVPRPDEIRAEQEMALMFEQSLQALEPSYLAAFLLYHQQGLSMEDLAQVLGISRTNAKVRVHRAREMVLQALRRKGFDV